MDAYKPYQTPTTFTSIADMVPTNFWDRLFGQGTKLTEGFMPDLVNNARDKAAWTQDKLQDIGAIPKPTFLERLFAPKPDPFPQEAQAYQAYQRQSPNLFGAAMNR